MEMLFLSIFLLIFKNVSTLPQDIVEERKVIETQDIVADGVPDEVTGKKCIDKEMFREETEYEEVMTCDHSYDERCHTSYITTYEPHLEEECDESFRKACWITYEDKAVNEVVKECLTENVKNCNEKGPEECKTVYDTVCETTQERHDVEDDVVNCKTENKEVCTNVRNGFNEEEKCDVLPQEVCEIAKKAVTKYSPKVECRKLSRKLCTAGCQIKQAEPVCNDKVKAVIVSKPFEECHMEPQKVCKQSTKLIPKLKPKQDCVQVPKEVCTMSKIKPTKKKIPFIQKLCYDDPKKVSSSQSSGDDAPVLAANVAEDEEEGEENFITSPNYPDRYGKNEDLTWLATVEEGLAIRFEILDFDIENQATCRYDWLEILHEDGSTVLKKSCGSVNNVPRVFKSFWNRAIVKFHSDNSFQKKGFKIKYSPIRREKNSSNQTITSTNFPKNYNNLEDRDWPIEVDLGNVIHFRFSDFELEAHSTCRYDWVSVRDIGADIDLLPKSCGRKKPENFKSVSNKALVKFHSDRSVTKKGFKLEITSEPTKTGKFIYLSTVH